MKELVLSWSCSHGWISMVLEPSDVSSGLETHREPPKELSFRPCQFAVLKYQNLQTSIFCMTDIKVVIMDYYDYNELCNQAWIPQLCLLASLTLSIGKHLISLFRPLDSFLWCIFLASVLNLSWTQRMYQMSRCLRWDWNDWVIMIKHLLNPTEESLAFLEIYLRRTSFTLNRDHWPVGPSPLSYIYHTCMSPWEVLGFSSLVISQSPTPTHLFCCYLSCFLFICWTISFIEVKVCFTFWIGLFSFNWGKRLVPL